MTFHQRCFCLILVMLLSVSAQAQQKAPAGRDAVADSDPFGDNPFADAPDAKTETKTKPPVASSDPFGGPANDDDPFSRPVQVDGKANSNAQATKHPASGTSPKPDASKSSKQRRMSSPTESEARIRSALSDETAQTFVEMPLIDALGDISRTHNIPVILDRLALEEVGLTEDVPVDLDLRGVTLRSFLRLMLRELQLTYVIHSEVLIITTNEGAAGYMTLATYSFDESLVNQSDQIVKTLTGSVSPDAWTTSGGRCNVSVVGNVLFVLGNESVLYGVSDFIAKLDAAFAGRH